MMLLTSLRELQFAPLVFRSGNGEVWVNKMRAAWKWRVKPLNLLERKGGAGSAPGLFDRKAVTAFRSEREGCEGKWKKWKG
jgi:hypothetical protein